MTRENPLAIEVTRGDAVESRHRAAAAVVGADGRIVAAWGDIDRPVFPRSAIKPLQALPLIETGAAERFAVTDAELALACASHGGEPDHVGRVGAWLSRIGLDGDDLACGPHSPMSDSEARRMARAGETPSRLHNNCSGKHAGFLATARHLDEPTAGYEHPDYPVQRRVLATLAEMGGLDAGTIGWAVDGCGVPTFALPLVAVARAMAGLAAAESLPANRGQAAGRILNAIAAHPYLIAGTGRFDTAIVAAFKGAVVVKGGAEGVHAAALPGSGMGIALKIDDGAGRAAETAMAALLDRYADRTVATRAALAPYLERPVQNAAGDIVGAVRPAAAWPD